MSQPETAVAFDPQDIRFLREVAERIRSSHLPGTLFFGVGVFAHLMNYSPDYVRKRMEGRPSIPAGGKELMFSLLDVIAVFSQSTEAEP